MIDILDELRLVVANLDEHEIDYALCGGMAMGEALKGESSNEGS